MIAEQLVDSFTACARSSSSWLRILFFEMAQEYIRLSYTRFAAIQIVLLSFFAHRLHDSSFFRK
jgi:hypothetical protein